VDQLLAQHLLLLLLLLLALCLQCYQIRLQQQQGQ
jgi:hypothetical protein